MLLAVPAFAAGETAAAAVITSGICIAAGLAIGIAAAGGGLGQGRAATALPKVLLATQAPQVSRGPMILGLALIESLVIYAFVIAILLVLKVREVGAFVEAVSGKQPHLCMLKRVAFAALFAF